MESKRQIIIKELKRVSEILERTRFTRNEFYKHKSIPITQDDIDNEFGSFAEAMIAAGLKPAKWRKITNKRLFIEYDKAYKKLGHYPLGHPGEKELSDLTPISGNTYRKRFGGLKNFLFEYKIWAINKSKKVKKNKTTITREKKLPVHSQDDYTVSPKVYIGKAAEHLVLYELLTRKFNCQIPAVDDGLDIFAVNLNVNNLYLIQVKHKYYTNDNDVRNFELTISSFERNKHSNVFYIFVLERIINTNKRKTSFLILPFHRIYPIFENELRKFKVKPKRIILKVEHDFEEKALIYKYDVSDCIDAWHLLI